MIVNTNLHNITKNIQRPDLGVLTSEYSRSIIAPVGISCYFK